MAMTLKQGFTIWACAPRNTVLAAKSRDAVQKVLMKKWGDLDLEVITPTMAERIFRESSESQELKVKAASILVYVLQWGGDNGHCQRPTFDYTIANAGKQDAPKPERTPMPKTLAEISGRTHLTDEHPAADKNEESKKETDMEKEKSKSLPDSKPVVRIDPETMLLAGIYESISKAQRETGINNITRAVNNRTLAGGYYWCLEENKSTFQPAEKKQTGRPSKPKTEQKAKKTVVNPSPAVQVAEVDNPTPSVTQQPAEDVQPALAERPVNYTLTPAPLSHYSDDDLLAELDRRGFQGELSRRVVYTIGEK